MFISKFLYVSLVFLHSYGKLGNFVVFHYNNYCSQDLWILENVKYFDIYYIYWHIFMRNMKKNKLGWIRNARIYTSSNFFTKISNLYMSTGQTMPPVILRIPNSLRLLNLILNFLFRFCVCFTNNRQNMRDSVQRNVL